MKPNGKRNIGAYMSDELVKKFDAAAKKRNIYSRSQALYIAVQEFIKSSGEGKK
jgi:metal-responsive CopG/Arc/MetJ family transcriptional regulator